MVTDVHISVKYNSDINVKDQLVISHSVTKVKEKKYKYK